MDVAWELLGSKPLADLTINEIAFKAGTTRPAIYRRWSSVEEIVIDAFLRAVQTNVPAPGNAEPPEQLHEYIRLLCKFINSRVGRVIAEILGRAQSDDALMTKFHEGFLLPRRDHGREIVRAGQNSGQFRKDLDTDLIIDLYAGPIYFRAFARYAAMDEAFAQVLADQVLQMVTAKHSGDMR